MQERNYANHAGSWGRSGTAHIDCDGTVVRPIDPVKHAAWRQATDFTFTLTAHAKFRGWDAASQPASSA